MDDERIWERREAALPKKKRCRSQLSGHPLLSVHFEHSLRRRDISPAVRALVFEGLDAHDGVDTLGQRNVRIQHLAVRVPPALARGDRHAEHVVRVDAVPYAGTRRALQPQLERKRERLRRLRRLPITVTVTVTSVARMMTTVRVAPERREQVREELLGVLLPHRRKLGVSAPDERLERHRPDALLEDGLQLRLRWWYVQVGWVLRRVRVGCAVARAGVPPGDESVRDLVHLAFEAGCWEGLGAPGPVLDCEVGGVALLEGRNGKENLHHGCHVTAVGCLATMYGACVHRKENLCVPVAEVLQTRQAGPKDRFEGIPRLVRERKVKAEVVLDLLVCQSPCSAFKS